MILALDTSDVLYIFATAAEASEELETIDIENHEYEFCDDTGRRYITEITVPVKAFCRGVFKLVGGNMESALPLAFVDRASELGRPLPGISSLNALRDNLALIHKYGDR